MDVSLEDMYKVVTNKNHFGVEFYNPIPLYFYNKKSVVKPRQAT
jgi:hypothetical protein